MAHATKVLRSFNCAMSAGRMRLIASIVCNLFIATLVLGSSGLHQLEQPGEFTSALLRLSEPLQLLVEKFSPGATITSILSVEEKYAVPSSQGWSRCQNCGLRNDGRVVLFQPNSTAQSPTLLSWSLWGEFFHKFNNDRIEAIYDTNFTALSKIDRPVFVLPVITLHVGHILIDLLEQLYQTHMRYYGKIRRDCVIILDVASESERGVLREKVYHSVNKDGSSVGALLRQFTDLPVFSIDLWQELSSHNNIIFTDLHLGLDISQTHFNAGQHSQPCIMSLAHGNTANIALAKRYRKFANYLRHPHNGNGNNNNEVHGQLDGSSTAIEALPQVLIVQRKKHRLILNIDDVLLVTQRSGLVTELTDLDTVDFPEQRQLFAHIDILVSVAGTALHNVLFMRPGSAMVMFMQPHWCAYAWMYANQAILLGIKPYVYCTPATAPLTHTNKEHVQGSTEQIILVQEDIQLAQWSRQLWLQGPRHHKSDNVTVNTAVYARLLEQAVAHVRDNKKTGNHLAENNFEVTIAEEGAARSLQPPHCPKPSSGSAKAAHNHPRPRQNTPHAEEATTNSAVTNDKQAKRMHRVVEIYISSVTAEYLSAEDSWKVGIVGEIGTAESEFSALLESMPHLSICMESVDMAPWCHPIAAFNYYTDLFLNMGAPVQALHVWAQVSSTGGKLRHSDVYVMLDCRLPEAGFALHHEIVGSEVSFEVILREECVPSTTATAQDPTSAQLPAQTQLQAQVLTYPTAKFGAPKLNCRSSKRLLFRQVMHSRLSLQRATADFCWAHGLTAANCVDFVTHLQVHLLRGQAVSARGLPAVRHEPSRANPFHFLHIEKTAGSTLREYISAAVTERNLSAFIPCHTEHCAVFAVPLHRANSTAADGTTNADLPAAATINWEALDDLRLIQPPSRDNSNLSVLAGHFDFYAPYRSLPQCRQPVSTTTTVGTSPAEALSARWSKHVLATVDPDRPTVPDTPQHSPTCTVSCLTVGRHPVDRAISYYYQRFYQHPDKVKNKTATVAAAAADVQRDSAASVEVPLNQRMINELTSQQLEMIALSTREGMSSQFYPDTQVFIDEGMADAACSALLGLKYTSGQRAGPIAIPPEIPATLYPRARANVQQCVVGLQEQWNQTLQVLDHWFPWLDFSENPGRKKMSIYSGLETRKSLRAELYNVLVALNPCDMMLYEEMQRIFASQLEVLKIDAY